MVELGAMAEKHLAIGAAQVNPLQVTIFRRIIEETICRNARNANKGDIKPQALKLVTGRLATDGKFFTRI